MALRNKHTLDDLPLIYRKGARGKVLTWVALYTKDSEQVLKKGTYSGCFGTLEHMAWDIACNRCTISRALKFLKTHGILKIEKEETPYAGNLKRNRYFIQWDRVATLCEQGKKDREAQEERARERALAGSKKLEKPAATRTEKQEAFQAPDGHENVQNATNGWLQNATNGLLQNAAVNMNTEQEDRTGIAVSFLDGSPDKQTDWNCSWTVSLPVAQNCESASTFLSLRVLDASLMGAGSCCQAIPSEADYAPAQDVLNASAAGCTAHHAVVVPEDEHPGILAQRAAQNAIERSGLDHPQQGANTMKPSELRGRSVADVARKFVEDKPDAETLLADWRERKPSPGHLSQFWRQMYGVLGYGMAMEFSVANQKTLENYMKRLPGWNAFEAIYAIQRDWKTFTRIADDRFGVFEKALSAAPTLRSLRLCLEALPSFLEQWNPEENMQLTAGASESSSTCSAPRKTQADRDEYSRQLEEYKAELKANGTLYQGTSYAPRKKTQAERDEYFRQVAEYTAALNAKGEA